MDIGGVAVDDGVARKPLFGRDGGNVGQKGPGLTTGGNITADENRRELEVGGETRLHANLADELVVQPHVADAMAVEAVAHIAVGSALERVAADLYDCVVAGVAEAGGVHGAANRAQHRGRLQLHDVNGVAAAMSVPDDDFIGASCKQPLNGGVDLVRKRLAGCWQVHCLVADGRVGASVDAAGTFQVRHDHDFHGVFLSFWVEVKIMGMTI